MEAFALPSYSYRPRRAHNLTSTITSGVQADEEENLQAVLDEAHEQGILEEPADAAEAREQGVVAARIDTDADEPVLVETVEPTPRRRRKRKAS